MATPSRVTAKPKFVQMGDAIRIPGKRGVWVVEEARMADGGTAMFNDYYPDGWRVTARLLGPQCVYNPKGRAITFHQSGCFNDVIEGVAVVGRMKRIFVWPKHE